MLSRVQRAIRNLDREQRVVGIAAIALLVTMFLPWYGKNVCDPKTGRCATDGISAFGSLTFVEAAVFLVSAGVLVLLFTRGERRAFHLPGGDGTVIFAAGIWAALLLLWRVFDKPDFGGAGTTVGIEWGFFFAFLAAAALAAAGWRMRQAHIPEPPNPMADDPATPEDESLSERLTLTEEDLQERSARTRRRDPPARRRDRR